VFRTSPTLRTQFGCIFVLVFFLLSFLFCFCSVFACHHLSFSEGKSLGRRLLVSKRFFLLLLFLLPPLDEVFRSENTRRRRTKEDKGKKEKNKIDSRERNKKSITEKNCERKNVSLSGWGSRERAAACLCFFTRCIPTRWARCRARPSRSLGRPCPSWRRRSWSPQCAWPPPRGRGRRRGRP